jgi:hypothetical protein
MERYKMGLKELGYESVDWIRLVGPVAGSCEHGNERSGSIKDGKFIDHLNDYQLINMDCSMEQVITKYVKIRQGIMMLLQP